MNKNLLIIVLIGIIVLANAAKSPGPLFMWSDKETFTTSKISVGYSNSDAIEDVLENIAAISNVKGSLNKYLNKDLPFPEAIVLFLKPHLTSSKFSVWANVYDTKQKTGGAFANLKNLFEHSKSSLAVHYSYLKDSFAADVLNKFGKNLHQQYPKSSTLIFSNLKTDEGHFPVFNSKWISLEKAEEYLVSNEGKQLLKNGEPDLLIFYLSSDETSEVVTSEDRLIGSISNLINIATDHNYLALFSSDVPEEHNYASIQNNDKQNVFLHANFIRNLAATNSSDDAGTYFPPQMWQAIFVSIVIVVALSIGISCTSGLQTPPKLLDEAMAKKKNK